MRLCSVLLSAALSLVVPVTVHAEIVASLRGSPAGMQTQNRVARDHGLAFYRTEADIRDAIDAGRLVELVPNENFDVADFVDIPFADPAVALFVERLSQQYREACGQRLVVTSAVRATSRQPSNAHALSVHPAGMAVDLRVSNIAECREWLENAILGMERQGLIDGIREYRPPHYHVAIFPAQYTAYALERAAEEAEMAAQREIELARAELAEVVVPQQAAMLVAQPAADDGSRSGGAARLIGVMFALGIVPAALVYRGRRSGGRVR